MTMRKPKTFFEQVPLDVIKKIAGEVAMHEKTTDPVLTIKKKKSGNGLLRAVAVRGKGGTS
jgi:hypothetical protein